MDQNVYGCERIVCRTIICTMTAQPSTSFYLMYMAHRRPFIGELIRHHPIAHNNAHPAALICTVYKVGKEDDESGSPMGNMDISGTTIQLLSLTISSIFHSPGIGATIFWTHLWRLPFNRLLICETQGSIALEVNLSKELVIYGDLLHTPCAKKFGRHLGWQLCITYYSQQGTYILIRHLWHILWGIQPLGRSATGRMKEGRTQKFEVAGRSYVSAV